MISEFNPRGSPPPRAHGTTMVEIEGCYDFNGHRRRLVDRLNKALENLKAAGLRQVWSDGSFFTSEAEPDDVDGCWDPVDDDPDRLDRLLLEFDDAKASMKKYYGVDFFPNIIEGASGEIFYKFFQYDSDMYQIGILLLNLGR